MAEELLKEKIRGALETVAAPEGALDSHQWAQLLGVSVDTFAKYRRALIQTGAMEHAGFKDAKSADGKRARVPIYVFKDGDGEG
ncbi:MAG: hypothetical protein P1V51_19975 [Deltaproteobacteria bacterium]|nr:hypothetical protein [Deltaproteobacteria bacterium]